MLIVAPERWDEACFAVPATRALAHTGMRVGVLCRDDQKAFWETLDHVTVVPHPAGIKPKPLAARLAGRWQAAVLWEPGAGAEACTRARIPRRVGPEGKPLRKYLTHPVTPQRGKGPPEHRMRDYLALVTAMGPGTDNPDFFAPAALGITPEPGTLLLCPDSDFGRTHEWPLDRWIETAKALLDGGRPLTVVCLSGGASLGKALVAALPEDTPFVEPRGLAELLPLLAVHHVVLAADGSLPHLAAHAGATCVTLFGPNDPLWKRPLGRRNLVVSRHAECAPCFLTKCPLDGRCQRELSTTRVWSALRQALGLEVGRTQAVT